MLSITLKRSAATLGVVAGLLAAAAPASGVPHDMLDSGGLTHKGRAVLDTGMLEHESLKTGVGTQIGSEG